MFLIGVSQACSAVGYDEKSKPAGSGEKAETHTVAKGRFVVAVSLDGVFVPQHMTEVVLRPETWTDLTVVEAAPHGRTVKKGDVLARLDRRKIDEEIRDEEAAHKQSELGIEQSLAELKVLEPSVPVDLATAERAKKNSEADLENFLKTDRDLATRSAELQVKQVQMMVDFAKDELEQLEKMYKADDLTEETEELILKRERNSLEFMQLYQEIAKIHHNQLLSVTLPRHEADLREAVGHHSLALDKIRSTLPLSVSKLKLDLEKQKYDLTKSTDKLRKLKRDAALLTVLSPSDGVVYYGAWTHGQWSGASSMDDKLKRGGSLSAHEVFITVVELRPLAVHVTVPEKELHRIAGGTACQVTLTANPGVRLAAHVESVAAVPEANDKFSAVLKLADESPPNDKTRLAPGMKCHAKAIAYDKADVLAIPAKALQTDEFDDQKHFVKIVDKDGKHARRDVAVGQRSSTKVEITSGLAEGDKVLLEKSPDEKDDKDAKDDKDDDE